MITIVAAVHTAAQRNRTRTADQEATANPLVERARVPREALFADPAVKHTIRLLSQLIVTL